MKPVSFCMRASFWEVVLGSARMARPRASIASTAGCFSLISDRDSYIEHVYVNSTTTESTTCIDTEQSSIREGRPTSKRACTPSCPPPPTHTHPLIPSYVGLQGHMIIPLHLSNVGRLLPTDLAGFHLFLNASCTLTHWFLSLQQLSALLYKLPQGIVLLIKLVHLIKQLGYQLCPGSCLIL